MIKKADLLYKRYWLCWRGKAGAFAKSGNKEMLKLSNEQKFRYFHKYCDNSGMNTEIKESLIKNKMV